MNLKLKFHPQVWCNDYTVPCDPEGQTKWEVEFFGVIPEDDTYESDDLRHLPGTPEWIENWEGPFYIEVLNREELNEPE